MSRLPPNPAFVILFCLLGLVASMSWPVAGPAQPAAPGHPAEPDSAPNRTSAPRLPTLRPTTLPDTAACGTLELVESVPLETDLDLPDLRQTATVWREMIAAARDSVAIETFYLTDQPDVQDELDEVLQALRAAAERGVDVRVLSDAGFHRTYPEVATRIAAWPHTQVRQLDAHAAWGGVLHAKLLLVDDSFFMGSQNWDWRSLVHIRELGVRVRHRQLAARLWDLFGRDWRFAGGEPATVYGRPIGEPDPPSTGCLLTAAGDSVQAMLAASPPEALGTLPWDEIALRLLVDSARDSLQLQLLTYAVESHGQRDDVLDAALRRAAARGVRVQIILSNWSKRASLLPQVRDLAGVDGIELRFSNIPEYSGGFVPYARVEHAKYLVADARRAWIGTGNWGPGYFRTSRNFSLFLNGRATGRMLARFFARSWQSPTSVPFDPGADYAPPRIGE